MSADELATQREMEQQAEAQKMEGIQAGIEGVGQAALGGVGAGTGNVDLSKAAANMNRQIK
jgi:hypothetical protein